jgi:enoyl-CoA hydratase/carnithine racemase
LIGASRANDMLLTGRKIGADEAERIGLVSRVVPDGTVVDVALETAERMCEFSAFGLQMTKKVCWANLETTSLTRRSTSRTATSCSSATPRTWSSASAPAREPQARLHRHAAPRRRSSTAPTPAEVLIRAARARRATSVDALDAQDDRTAARSPVSMGVAVGSGAGVAGGGW